MRYKDALQALGLRTIQEVYAWVVSVGYAKAVAILSSASFRIYRAGESAVAFYLMNKVAIDEAARVALGVVFKGSQITPLTPRARLIQQSPKLGRAVLERRAKK